MFSDGGLGGGRAFIFLNTPTPEIRFPKHSQKRKIFMNIAIIHQDLEWTETKILELFLEQDCSAKLYDIRTTEERDLAHFDLVINRVYASVANRNPDDNSKTLELLKQLENRGVCCINSYATTLADYSKSYSAKLMHENGVNTARTFKVNSSADFPRAIAFTSEVNFPVILKRDMGGRAFEVMYINNVEELQVRLSKAFDPQTLNSYNHAYVVQEFIKSADNFDCRIGIVDDTCSFAYGRTLLRTNDSPPWLASHSRGSELISYSPDSKVIDIAIRATQSIGALFNELDIALTEKGPVIIENNPTPNFIDEPEDVKRLEGVIHTILNKYQSFGS